MDIFLVIVNSESDSHPEKTLFPSLSVLSGTEIFFSDLQSENTPSSRRVRPSGSFIFIRPVHPEKALSPSEATVSGTEMEVIPVHPENALCPIRSIDSGMVS